VEPPGGDPFFDVYPAYRQWNRQSVLAQRDRLDELLSRADVCITGGEDFPGLAWSFDPDLLSRANPKLVVLVLRGYAANIPGAPAVDLLVQARTGLVFEQ